jgi:RNA polymerase sigma-70 factor (ECF subfamily)
MKRIRANVIPLRRVQGTLPEMSDDALVAACAVGDVPALGALFDRHRAGVYRFLSRLCANHRADLDDLVQSTFIEVFRGAARFSKGATVGTWIFGIAANVARHHSRGERRSQALAASAAERLQRVVPRPDDIAEHRQTLDRVAQALARLPHDLRVAFVMCDIEQVRPVDAARALGVREGTMGRRLYEARRAMREVFGESST